MKKHHNGADILPKAVIYLVLIVFAVSIIVPVSWAFLASVKQNSEFYGNPWAFPKGFYYQNFIDAFNKANMGSYLLNSVIVTALALAILLIIALPAAYVLARTDFFGRRLLKTAFMGGLFINVNYIVVPIFLMLVNGDKWIKSVFGNTFLLNNLTIPKDYEEAAFVDGSGYFRTMLQIIFPMARPSIITVILFNFLSFWNEYIISMTLMTGNTRTLPVGLMNLMKAQNAAAQYGQMYAGLVMVMLPTLILYILVQKKLTQGMTVGGLKG